MGTLTYNELAGEIKDNHGNRNDLTDARLVRALNICQQRIGRAHRWQELEVLYEKSITNSGSDDDKFIQMPVEFRDFYSVRVINGTMSAKLEFVSFRVWDRRIPAPQARARYQPSLYTYWRQMLEIWPLPDTTYLLRARGIEWPTKFDGETNSTQVSQLQEKDDMLVALTTSYLFHKFGDRKKASAWWGQYANMLNAAIGEERENPDALHLPHQGVTGTPMSTEPWRDPFTRSIR